MSWRYGEPFGGTSPILLGDKYLTFFHSWTADTDDYRRSPRIYHIGAYIFNSKPPFNVLSYLPSQLEYDDMNIQYNKDTPTGHKVRFPMSRLSDGEYIILTFGEDDIHTKIIRINLDKLLFRMI
jgi:hypothetical protein